jgi:uncharacterized oligopeptide transporter (OPT) family protein
MALVIGSILGVVFTLLETRWRTWTPSATGVGIGMLVPAFVITTMFIGGLLEYFWTRTNKSSAEAYLVPLASGLIAGEAIVAILVPVLIAFGVLHI